MNFKRGCPPKISQYLLLKTAVNGKMHFPPAEPARGRRQTGMSFLCLKRVAVLLWRPSLAIQVLKPHWLANRCKRHEISVPLHLDFQPHSDPPRHSPGFPSFRNTLGLHRLHCSTNSLVIGTETNSSFWSPFLQGAWQAVTISASTATPRAKVGFLLLVWPFLQDWNILLWRGRSLLKHETQKTQGHLHSLLTLHHQGPTGVKEAFGGIATSQETPAMQLHKLQQHSLFKEENIDTQQRWILLFQVNIKEKGIDLW